MFSHIDIYHLVKICEYYRGCSVLSDVKIRVHFPHSIEIDAILSTTTIFSQFEFDIGLVCILEIVAENLRKTKQRRSRKYFVAAYHHQNILCVSKTCCKNRPPTSVDNGLCKMKFV